LGKQIWKVDSWWGMGKGFTFVVLEKEEAQPEEVSGMESRGL